MMDSAGTRTNGCYICQPENPDALEEGCDECESRFIAYFGRAYAEEIAEEDRQWKR